MNRNLLWLDFETGGLDPAESSPIEICLAETDYAGNILKTLTSQIFPYSAVHPEGAKVNGYTAEKWAGAPSLYDVRLKILQAQFSQGCNLAGWNVTFDQKFLNTYFPDAVRALKLHYHLFDLMAMAWPYLKGCEKVNLETAYKMLLGRPMIGAHSAEGDVMGMVAIYNCVMRHHGV